MNTPILKTIITPIFIVSVLPLVACQEAEVPEEQAAVEAEASAESVVDVHEHEAAVEIEDAAAPSADVNEEDLRPYDLKDPSTWGEPIGFDSDGDPTGYSRVMPNGNVRTASPFHGQPNTAINPDPHPVHAATPPEDTEYQHWHHGDMSNPLPVVSCVGGQWSGSVNKYIPVWSQSPFISMIPQPHPEGLSGEDCFDNEVSGAITIANFDFSSKWPSQKIVEYAGYAFGDHDPDGHMTSVVIALNDGKDWFDPRLTPADEIAAWRDMTVCHEMGHALGLGHNDIDKNTVTGTCMDYSRTPFPNLNPDAHDFEHIAEAYDHTHGGMGTSCKLGTAMDQSGESEAFYAIVLADDFFKAPHAPERKENVDWVAVKKLSGSEIGSMVSVDQFRPALFDEQEYFVHDETSEYGYGVVDPGPNHTYFDAFASQQELQVLLDQEIQQYVMIGLLEDCEEWEVHLPDLLWDTSLEYYRLNSPELRAKSQEVDEAKRSK